MQVHRLGDAGEGRGSRIAIDQGGAIKQEPGRQHAEHEIFQPGLGRAQVIAMEGGDDVQRKTLKLEREVERDQIVGRDGQHHACGREQDEDWVFEAKDAFPSHIVERQDEGEGRAREGQDFHEARETIVNERAVEQFLGHGGMAGDQKRGAEQDQDRYDANDEAGLTPMINAPHQ